MRLSSGSVIVHASVDIADPATFAAAERALEQDTASLSTALGVIVLEKPTVKVGAVRRPPQPGGEGARGLIGGGGGGGRRGWAPCFRQGTGGG